MAELTCIEICAGAGGQALGLEHAGFAHAAVVDIDPDACETLRRNRGSQWKIIEADVAVVNGAEFRGVDLLAGGVPCPPFSVAGHQLGAADERDLFPEALRLTSEIQPRAVLLENVRRWPLAGSTLTGRKSWPDWASLATRAGGGSCTRVIMACRSCGRDLCWSRSGGHGQRLSAGRRPQRRGRPRSVRRSPT